MPWPKWLTSAAALLEEPPVEVPQKQEVIEPSAEVPQKQSIEPQVDVEQMQRLQLEEKRRQVEAGTVPLKGVPEKYTTQVEAREEADIRADIRGVNTDIAELEGIFCLKSSELLPIEENARNLLQRTHAESRSKANERVRALELECTTALLDRRFRRIDMSFLKQCKWSEKNQCPAPMFGIFTVNDPWCRMNLRVQKSGPKEYTAQWWGGGIQSNLLQYISQEFLIQEAAPKLHGWRDESVSVTAETQFTGVIPVTVRELIKREQSNFERIYVIAEVNDWDLRVVPAADPLVIGEKLGQFWFLEMFDTTPSEQFVVDNYTKQMPETR